MGIVVGNFIFLRSEGIREGEGRDKRGKNVIKCSIVANHGAMLE